MCDFPTKCNGTLKGYFFCVLLRVNESLISKMFFFFRLIDSISKNITHFEKKFFGGKVISMDTQAETQTELEEEVEEPLELPRAISQWASHVISRSSSYEHGWNAECICGPPRVFPHYGDVCCCYCFTFLLKLFCFVVVFCFQIRGSWAPLAPKGTLEWIEFRFQRPCHIVRVDIYETFNPGHVTRLSAMGSLPDGEVGIGWRSIWEESVEERNLTYTTPPLSSRINSPAHPVIPWITDSLRIDLDCRDSISWVEIDAVKIIGILPEDLMWSPFTHSLLFPPSFKRMAKAMLLINNRIGAGLSLDVIGEILLDAYRLGWSFNKSDSHSIQLHRALTSQCGFSVLAGGWICRGASRGCKGGQVFGTGCFSSASNPCHSAVHSGIIDLHEGGAFAIIPTSVPLVTPGCVSNGISSGSSRVSSVCDQTFVVCEAVGIGKRVSACGKKGPFFFCEGRANGCVGGPVWGTRFYRSDSNVCTAALHSL